MKIQKDGDVPETCNDCAYCMFSIPSLCSKMSIPLGNINRRPDWCPLVPVGAVPPLTSYEKKSMNISDEPKSSCPLIKFPVMSGSMAGLDKDGKVDWDIYRKLFFRAEHLEKELQETRKRDGRIDDVVQAARELVMERHPIQFINRKTELKNTIMSLDGIEEG